MAGDADELERLHQVTRLARLAARVTKSDRKPLGTTRIFISYRRENAGHAGRLFDRLQPIFGQHGVFMDLENIGSGADFVDRLERELEATAALVVLIGPQWLAAEDAGWRRLDNPKDWVRREIAAGLKRDILVLPVLIGGAKMPTADELPKSIRALARRNALEIGDRRWDEGLANLLDILQHAPASPAEGPAGRPGGRGTGLGRGGTVSRPHEVRPFRRRIRRAGPRLQPTRLPGHRRRGPDGRRARNRVRSLRRRGSRLVRASLDGANPRRGRVDEPGD
jgi:hypothetical protein